MPRITYHAQKDGSIIMFTHPHFLFAQREGAKKIGSHQLDDGTQVPVFQYKDGSQFLPAVTLNARPVKVSV